MIRTHHDMIRVGSPHIVTRMADANGVPCTVSRYAASVTLAGTVYFWSAA